MMAAIESLLARRHLVALSLLVALACGTRTMGTGETGDGATSDDGSGDDGGDSNDTGGDGDSDDGATDDGADTGPPPLGPAAVDILFVVDNTGSMGEEQASLTVGLSELLLPLEERSVDYRVGVTTTDNSNPWCSGTTPEAGSLRASSCRSRLEEFVFVGTDPPTDKKDEACLAVCKHEDVDIQPSATDVDPTPAVHPWVESIGGQTNLPDDLTVDGALRCLLPQGINGCGFEQPLESMYKALRRAQTPAEANYGFMRDDAHLVVILVSDEVDCSYKVEHDVIFLPEGSRVFWSDPDAAYPTSAVCWNAGVACTGGPGTYDECHAANKDEDANLTDADQAVLHDVSRYIGLLQEIENAKREHGQASVIVAGILGVPVGYEEGGEIVYQDGDEAAQMDWGIGPGCEGATGFALPPVRQRRLAERFETEGRRNLYSVCQGDYAHAFARVAQEILAHVKP